MNETKVVNVWLPNGEIKRITVEIQLPYDEVDLYSKAAEDVTTWAATHGMVYDDLYWELEDKDD